MHQSKILNTIGPQKCEEILQQYKSKKTIQEISVQYKFPRHWVRKVLLTNNVKISSGGSFVRWNPSKKEKQEAIQLYTQEKRGFQYIAMRFKTSWERVSVCFKEWNIPKVSRSDLQTSNRLHYGITKGFSGRTHTSQSKEKIAKSLRKNCNRKSTGPKSQFIQTSVGKVQGSFEVAYLQKCLNSGISLPATGSTVKTPYGLYYPDFEYSKTFVEVKSPFTWDVCRGLRENGKGIKSAVQHKKIKWVDKNVKPVKVVVLEEKETEPLFKQAIKNKSLVLEDIIWKRGRYYKNEPILGNGC